MVRVTTELEANVVVNRVWIGTDSEVAPAGSVADVGGVTMFWLPAVPPALNLTVIGLADGPDAVHRRQVARTDLRKHTQEKV